MSGMTLQQVFVVEFTVANQMCDDCHRSEAQDYWRALVSVFLLNTTSLYILHRYDMANFHPIISIVCCLYSY